MVVAKRRAGQLLPWSRRPFGYQRDPERPRDPAGVRFDPYEAAIVQQMCAWYLQEHATLYRLAKQLQAAGIQSPRGSAYWTTGSIRAVLRTAAYTGTAYGNRSRSILARGRRKALTPVGQGTS